MRFTGYMLVGVLIIAPRIGKAFNEGTPDLKQCQDAEKATNVCCVSVDPTFCFNPVQQAEKVKLDKLISDGQHGGDFRKAMVKMSEIHLSVCRKAIFDCVAGCSPYAAMLAKCRNYSDRLDYFRDMMKAPIPTAEDVRKMPVNNVVPAGGTSVAPEGL